MFFSIREKVLGWVNLLVESPSTIINGDPKSAGHTGECVTVLIFAGEVQGDPILLLFLLRASEWMIDIHIRRKHIGYTLEKPLWLIFQYHVIFSF